MIKIVNSIRAGLKLGKAQGFLKKKRYNAAIKVAEQVLKLGVDENLAWVCFSIKGKSLYHLGEHETALLYLDKSKGILVSMLIEDQVSTYLFTEINNIRWHINKIEAAKQEADMS